jgi:hypothetical protein
MRLPVLKGASSSEPSSSALSPGPDRGLFTCRPTISHNAAGGDKGFVTHTEQFSTSPAPKRGFVYFQTNPGSGLCCRRRRIGVCLLVGLTTDKVLRLCPNQQFSVVSTGEYGFIYLQARLTTRQRTITVKKEVGVVYSRSCCRGASFLRLGDLMTPDGNALVPGLVVLHGLTGWLRQIRQLPMLCCQTRKAMVEKQNLRSRQTLQSERNTTKSTSEEQKKGAFTSTWSCMVQVEFSAVPD